MQSHKEDKEKEERLPWDYPRPIEIEDLEQPSEYEDQEEIRRIFAKEIEERKKESQFYE